ncbi:MAG TPA: PEP-CTERM sorting domain-containing protein, partial [Pirellulales bacterium]
DQQIVTNSGFTPNTATTFFNIQPFVLLPVPEPATYALAIVACFGLALRRRMVAGPKSVGGNST